MDKIMQDKKEIAAGERIYPKDWSEIAVDHAERYKFALNFVEEGDNVLDAACGVGYGSYYIAANSKCNGVIALDISDHALAWAKTYFQCDRVIFLEANLEEDFIHQLPINQFDIITCFETIEHLNDEKNFLRRINSLLKPQGTLVISSPNEDVIPYGKDPYFKDGINPFHHRHYRPEQLKELVEDCGFSVEGCYTQYNQVVEKGQGGYVNVLVCKNI